MRLNLGCGKLHKAGYINADNNPMCKPDIVFDVSTDIWPYEDNTFDIAEADNLIEHIGWSAHGYDLLMHFMNEAYRVVKKNGVLWIRVPDFEKWPCGAVRDPTHRRFFVNGSFDYWDNSHQTYKNYGSVYGYKPWKLERKTVATPQGQHFLDILQTPIK